MAYKKIIHHVVNFKNMGGVNVPLQPWPQTFYVSQFLLETTDMIEIRPLTVMGLIKGLGANFICMNFWRACYLLRKSGFLTTPEGEMFSFRHWQWRFWHK